MQIFQEDMTHDTNRYIIGIDPDVDKSGYALIDMTTKQVTVGTASLPVLLETIGSLRGREDAIRAVRESMERQILN